MVTPSLQKMLMEVKKKKKKTLDIYNEENRKFQLNSRAIYILVCAMDRNEYNRISQFKTAKEV